MTRMYSPTHHTTHPFLFWSVMADNSLPNTTPNKRHWLHPYIPLTSETMEVIRKLQGPKVCFGFVADHSVTVCVLLCNPTSMFLSKNQWSEIHIRLHQSNLDDTRQSLSEISPNTAMEVKDHRKPFLIPENLENVPRPSF